MEPKRYRSHTGQHQTQKILLYASFTPSIGYNIIPWHFAFAFLYDVKRNKLCVLARTGMALNRCMGIQTKGVVLVYSMIITQSPLEKKEQMKTPRSMHPHLLAICAWRQNCGKLKNDKPAGPYGRTSLVENNKSSRTFDYYSHPVTTTKNDQSKLMMCSIVQCAGNCVERCSLGSFMLVWRCACL